MVRHPENARSRAVGRLAWRPGSGVETTYAVLNHVARWASKPSEREEKRRGSQHRTESPPGKAPAGPQERGGQKPYRLSSKSLGSCLELRHDQVGRLRGVCELSVDVNGVEALGAICTVGVPIQAPVEGADTPRPPFLCAAPQAGEKRARPRAPEASATRSFPDVIWCAYR